MRCREVERIDLLRVLIYPYWNVNAPSSMRLRRDYAVLIYPYWNVNVSPVGFYNDSVTVLIYPYWNVNIAASRPRNHVGNRFNLSILECKFFAFVR